MIGINPRDLMQLGEEVSNYFSQGMNDEEIHDAMAGKIDPKQIRQIRKLIGLRKIKTPKTKHVFWKGDKAKVQNINLFKYLEDLKLSNGIRYEVHVVDVKPMLMTLEFRTPAEGE